MAEKLVVGPVNKGLKTNVLPFNIDNDSFPTLINAYQWRGRVKRKRGTSTLGRLQRFFTDTSLTYNPTDASLTLNGSGVGNVFTAFGLQPNASIIPGTFSVTFGATTFKDPTEDGYLTPTGTGGDNLINYATGTITIPTLPNRSDLALSFWYYPALPVMGIEDWINPSSIQFPGTIEFDKEYSYNQQVVEPYGNYDVSFYKNPPDNATTMPGYVAKTTLTPTTWNGQNYQQFWICAAEGERLCDAHEWEGACAGSLQPPDYRFDLARNQPADAAIHQMRIAHNLAHQADKTWSYGPEYQRGICATGSFKTPGCPGGGWQLCGSNTYPTGDFPACHSPLDVYDLNGNAAEHMNLPLNEQQMSSRGSKELGYTEMKGSWFIFDTYRAHEDWCRWRAPFWHGTRVMDPASHANYHLGFRCCKTIEPTEEGPLPH